MSCEESHEVINVWSFSNLEKQTTTISNVLKLTSGALT